MRSLFALLLAPLFACGAHAEPPDPASFAVQRTEAEWRASLDEMSYKVLREAATERAFTGALWDEHRDGTYVCAGCGAVLFDSDTKFDSGTGWPSFWQPAGADAVATSVDYAWGMQRTEVHCPKCGGHLGHVFDDGPAPTGQRYCMNSAAMRFQPKPAPVATPAPKR